MYLSVVGRVFGLWSDSDSDVESSLLGFSTTGEASAFVLRTDGMNLWSAGIFAMALATSSVPNLISTGLISVPVLKLPIGISCSLSFCISTVLLVSGSSPKANNASMASSSSVVVHVSCPMGSTLGCTVTYFPVQMVRPVWVCCCTYYRVTCTGLFNSKVIRGCI